MTMRPYNHKKDRKAVHRVLREVGWLPSEDPEVVAAQDAFTTGARAFVSDLAGAPECLVSTMPGTIKYLDEELSLCCVTGVCTSKVARKQGLAAKLTAHAVAQCAADGAEVAGLGFFEQGFYDRFGFGTGVYELNSRFDPADLTVTARPRVPVRITMKDWREVHAARLRSLRRHGGATVLTPAFTRLRMTNMEKLRKGFGLGYRDGKGRITHHFWCINPEGQSGPLNIMWFSFETYEQFLELLALVKGLGDEIRTVTMTNPSHVQMQDLVSHPARSSTAREDSPHRTGTTGSAFWQLRINDLAACLKKTHLGCEPFSFNLELADPIEAFLGKGERWKGAGGNYVVTLGKRSSAVRGTKCGLPTLVATVNAFTRMWIGAVPATTLAITDRLSGEARLLAKLDEAFCLPKPYLNWFF
jgi:predicted acetyltransferase